MNINEIYDDIQKNITESIISQNEDMSKHTTFRIGGKADIFIKVKNIDDLKYILKYSKDNNIPLTVIGNGSNVLVKDNGIRGITISIDFNEIDIEERDNKVYVSAGAGVKLGMLAVMLQKKGVSGLEFASGIPGTLGGAVRMNAGAYGKEMKEIVKEVTYIDEYLNINVVQNETVDFSYRHSRFKEKNEIIIKSKIELTKENPETIKNQMDIYKSLRIEKQPIDMPSAGSTFKRGTNFIASKLIDEAGLKGYTIGGAQVSTKHAGFIVNTGNAPANDVIELVNYVIKTVYEKFGKILELEIEVIGE